MPPPDAEEPLVLNISDNSILFDLAKRDHSPVRPARLFAADLSEDADLVVPVPAKPALPAKPTGFTAEQFGWKPGTGQLSPIGEMVRQQLGERYVFPRIKLGADAGDLTCLVEWESWEARINTLWNDAAASASYTLVLAFFIQRVEAADEGYLELALLLDRYCSPFTPRSRPIAERALDRLEAALRQLDVASSPTTCSVLLALRRRHRFVLESPSWPGFVFHGVFEGAKGRDAFDLDLLYADTNWPRSTNTPEQSPRVLSPSPYSPPRPACAPSSPHARFEPLYAPTSPSYPWRSPPPPASPGGRKVNH